MKEILTYEKVIKLPIRKVKWLDATDRTVKISELDDKIDVDLVTERTTIGWLYRDNKNVIVLIRDVTEDGEVELCSIPKKWVI